HHEATAATNQREHHCRWIRKACAMGRNTNWFCITRRAEIFYRDGSRQLADPPLHHTLLLPALARACYSQRHALTLQDRLRQQPHSHRRGNPDCAAPTCDYLSSFSECFLPHGASYSNRNPDCICGFEHTLLGCGVGEESEEDKGD